MISISSFSIIKNDIIISFFFTREARMMRSSTIFAIQNIENPTLLEKSIDEIKKFQKKYLKDHKGSVELNLLKNLF